MGSQTIYGQFSDHSVFTQARTAFAGADISPGSGPAWTNPGNITLSDPSAATLAPAGTGISHYLVGSSFGFTIPANATIIGLQATFQDQAAGGSGSYGITQCWVFTGASVIAASGPRTIINQVPSTKAPIIIGGPNDIWNTPLTPAQVNAAAFGIGIQVSFTAAAGVTISAFAPWTVTVFYSLPSSSGIVLQDSDPAPLQSQWTAGASMAARVTAGPGLTNPWLITGWGVSFQGQLISPTLYYGGYGLLGQVWGGLLIGSSPAPTPSPFPWLTPGLGFPNDMSTFAPIWDGANDPPFPRGDNTVAGQAAGPPNPPAKLNAFNFPLPQPVTMQPGDQIGIGMWLTPSLVFDTIVQLLNARWSITYDDGVR